MKLTLLIIALVSLIHGRYVVLKKARKAKQDKRKVDITTESILIILSILTIINYFL